MRKINEIPVAVLSTFGHCGTDWLHSLIDSHKEVLIIPPLSFFRKIDILKKIKKIDLDTSLSAKQITNIFMNELFQKSPHKNKTNNILNKNQSKSKFKKYINDFLIVEKKIDIQKRLFFAIHHAFAKINKINLEKIKTIVSHEHVPWNCHYYNEYFNSKFVFIVRDPRATIGGSLRTFRRTKNIPINFQIDMGLSYMISAHKFFTNMTRKKILILRNEDMHKNLKLEMKKLSKWLNIKFNKSLLNSTFLGKRWIGESGYISKLDLKNEYPKNYYKPINIETRWRSILDKKAILMIETVLEEIMIQNKYKFDNKLNIVSRFFGYLIFLFKFHAFNNFSYLLKLRFIKNIIRRIFVVFFSAQSRKIFDIM